MKKIIFVFVLFLGLGLIYWLVLTLFVNKKINEELPLESESENTMMEDVNLEMKSEEATKQNEFEEGVLKIGVFQGEAGHEAKGIVSLVKIGGKIFVRFEDGFEVTNGPDLFVHFGKNGEYVKDAEIGALKGNLGSQNYEIPAELNIDDYNEVWVWCRAFSVPFASAKLE